MSKKQKLILIVIANLLVSIPMTLFVLAIFEYAGDDLGELYVNLGFSSLMFLIIVAPANIFAISEL